MTPKLEIELTATHGGARATCLRYELKNAMIRSYQTHASGNDEAGPPTVVAGNNFEEIELTYTEYDNDVSSKGNIETSYKVGATRARAAGSRRVAVSARKSSRGSRS